MSEFAHPKRPRQYVAEILALPKEERRAALDNVPDEYRALVEYMIRDWWVKRRANEQRRTY